MTRAYVDRRVIGEALPMTLYQRGVAACILDALSNKEIARAMGNCETTTEQNVARLMRKLQARNRVDLALKLQVMAMQE